MDSYIRYNIRAVSDSKELGDLDKVKIREILIRPTNPTGFIKFLVENFPIAVGRFKPATEHTGKTGAIRDDNAIFAAGATRAAAVEAFQKGIKELETGSGDYLQYQIFSDERTGVPEDEKKAAIVPNSGFKITQAVDTRAGGRRYYVYVTRVPSAVPNIATKPGIISADDQKRKEDEID